MTGDVLWGLSQTDWTGISALGTCLAAIVTLGVLLQSKGQIKSAQESLALLKEQNKQLTKAYDQRQREKILDDSILSSAVIVEYKRNPSLRGRVKIHKDIGTSNWQWNFRQNSKEYGALIEEMPSSHKNGNGSYKIKVDAVESMEELYDIISYDL